MRKPEVNFDFYNSKKIFYSACFSHKVKHLNIHVCVHMHTHTGNKLFCAIRIPIISMEMICTNYAIYNNLSPLHEKKLTKFKLNLWSQRTELSFLMTLSEVNALL